MSESVTENKRLLYYDILKAVLIFFVVLGHSIDTFSTNTALKTVYLCIYTFHMPLFVFISGFFSKWNKRKFFGYFLLYFIFTILQILLKVFVISPNASYTFSKILKMFVNPLWGLWFLPALAVWLLCAKFFKKVKVWHILVAVIVTLGLGFVPFINSEFTLSRIFYFFPFFLMGKYCKQNKEKFSILLQKVQKITYKLLALFVLILTFALIMLFVHFMSKGYFYGKYAYDNAFGIVNRIISILVGVITSACLMILLPYKIDEKSRFYSFVAKIGQRTLSVYLFHILILLIFKKFCAVYFSSHYVISLTASIVLSIVIILITTLKPFVKSVDFMLNCFIRRNKNEKLLKKTNS